MVLGIEDRSVSDSASVSTSNDCGIDVPFGAPQLVTELNSDYDDTDLRLSADGLTGYFVVRTGTFGQRDWWTESDIYVAHRKTPTGRFGKPEKASFTEASPIGEDHPSETADGLNVYYERVDLDGESGIQHVKRSSAEDPYPMVAPGGNPDGLVGAGEPYVVADGSAIYYIANPRSESDFDLYRAPLHDGAPGRGAPLEEINRHGTGLDVADMSPVVTPDELVLYFTSSRAGGKGLLDIWVASRPRRDVPFGEPRPISELNTSGVDEVSFVTADNCTLYLNGTWSPDSRRIDLYRADKRR
jgi:hypothetical protein